MQKIVPFLWFDGQAEEAANFYVSIFKNSRIVKLSGGPGGKVMGVTFQLEGHDFVRGINGGPHFKFAPAISLFVNCCSQEEVDDLWERLSRAARSNAAPGSRTGTACPGRSSRPPWARCCRTRTPRSPGASCRRCCRWTRSTSAVCAEPTTEARSHGPPEGLTTKRMEKSTMHKLVTCLVGSTIRPKRRQVLHVRLQEVEARADTRYGKEGHEIHGGREGTVMTVDFELEGQRYVALNSGPILSSTRPSPSRCTARRGGGGLLLGEAVGRRRSEGAAVRMAPRTSTGCRGRSSPPTSSNISRTRIASGPTGS